MPTEWTHNLMTFIFPVKYGQTAKDYHTFEDSLQYERLKLALALEETHLQGSEGKKWNYNKVLGEKGTI